MYWCGSARKVWLESSRNRMLYSFWRIRLKIPLQHSTGTRRIATNTSSATSKTSAQSLRTEDIHTKQLNIQNQLCSAPQHKFLVLQKFSNLPLVEQMAARHSITFISGLDVVNDNRQIGHSTKINVVLEKQQTLLVLNTHEKVRWLSHRIEHLEKTPVLRDWYSNVSGFRLRRVSR